MTITFVVTKLEHSTTSPSKVELSSKGERNFTNSIYLYLPRDEAQNLKIGNCFTLKSDV